MNATGILLEDEAATERLGADIAMALAPGDAVWLKGDLGAGKTTLARGIIRQLAGDPELEIPSPTYTICQTYELELPVSHFDLYRLKDAGEAGELGIAEAAEAGVVLVEWPERGAGHLGNEAFLVELSDAPGAGRLARLGAAGNAGKLAGRVARSLEIRGFADAHGFKAAPRRHLQGDASTRRYETLLKAGRRWVLMDAPRRPDGPPVKDGKPYSQIAHLAEDVVPFVAIARELARSGLGAPEIVASSFAKGLLILEHLGEESLLDASGNPLADRYLSAARLLAGLHTQRWRGVIPVADSAGDRRVHTVPAYDRQALLIEASLLVDWYAPQQGKGALAVADREAFFDIWNELVSIIETSGRTLVLRDYHSPNLIWRPDAVFPKNLGLLDFQDAVEGSPAYDLASIAQDARVDVPAALEAAMIEAYFAARGNAGHFETETFRRDYAIMAAHRATKILGIFVRLKERDGKPGYMRHLPRLQNYLARNFAHPVLARYRNWFENVAGRLPPVNAGLLRK